MLQKTQTFNDGAVGIYTVTNISPPGKMPKEGVALKHTLRYKERTVGMQRFYAAMQANIRINYVLRCPKLRDITTKDVAIPNDGKQYKIVQIQYPEDLDVMDLTLEELTAKYEVAS
jgi:SPP1 family predicted phage head-tail adaptor